MAKARKHMAENSPKKVRSVSDLRLARLEGQVQALRRMVGVTDDWKKMLTLAAAIEGAADQATADLFEKYLESLNGGKELGVDARKALDLVLRRL
ncbi:MAG: metal-sensing transcriptional repressor [Elusimicrobia bacterium]|nr:metal-sensing transcriptional repressor [Elusimicrobiota bacterium]